MPFSLHMRNPFHLPFEIPFKVALFNKHKAEAHDTEEEGSVSLIQSVCTDVYTIYR